MIKHLSDTITSTVDTFVARRPGVDYIGIPTGFPKLDKIFTGGLRKNNLYVIAGRTGMGKSAMGLSKALNIAKNGEYVFYISLEMSNEILATRLLSSLSNIPTQKLEYGKFSDQEYQRLVQAQAELINLPIWTLDQVINSTEAIEQASSVDKISTLFVDHASLLNDAN
jgi:replicative DNA helicase